MNNKNSQKLKLSLPPVIAGIIGSRTLTKRIIGRSGQLVYAVGQDLYLKISTDLESLRRERDTDIWLEGKLPGGMTVPRVGAYDEVAHPENGIIHGYLLTSAVHGVPACAPSYLKDPNRLVSLLAEALHIFHSLPTEGCPSPAVCNKPYNTVIHGDFCLPNILLHRSRVNGFVDLGQVKVGDPWEDYAWCLWSLEYNLKTNAYNQLLLDKIGIPFNEEKYKKYVDA